MNKKMIFVLEVRSEKQEVKGTDAILNLYIPNNSDFIAFRFSLTILKKFKI
jgi:hypothetical protein